MGRADDRQPVELDDDLIAQMARLGADVSGLSPAPQPQTAFDVMAQNRETVLAWLDVETQWRVATGFNQIIWLGLDYNAVDVVLRRRGLAQPDDVFSDLILMEAEALAVFRKESQ